MSSVEALVAQDWQIRWYVYNFFIERERPPTASEVAHTFSMSLDAAQASMERLDARHLFVLDKETRAVRIANPLSAVPTGFRVHAAGRTYWANCAWDALGIPAMLGSDARIEATITSATPGQDEPIAYQVRDGELLVPDLLVHFSLPLRHWYDDIVHT